MTKRLKALRICCTNFVTILFELSESQVVELFDIGRLSQELKQIVDCFLILHEELCVFLQKLAETLLDGVVLFELKIQLTEAFQGLKTPVTRKVKHEK